MKCLLASFGFDEKFALHSIMDHRPEKVYLIALDTSGSASVRIERASNILKSVASSLGIYVELRKIPYTSENIPELVYKVKKHIRQIADKCSEIIVSLTGGPRLLVIALFLAVQTLPNLASKTVVRLEGEGFEAVVENSVKELQPIYLSEISRAVLGLLAEDHTNSGIGLGPSTVASLLNIPKSTAHKKLQELVAKGLASHNPKQGLYKITGRGLINA